MRARSCLVVCAIAALAVVEAVDTACATAYMQPTSKADYPELDGSVWFHQMGPSGDGEIPDVIVDVSDLVGVPIGYHGFHVHTYGDTESSALVGGHFVPICIDDGESVVDVCENDRIHGIPPSQTRNPGDMGNLYCSYADGDLVTTCVLCFEGQNHTNGLCTARKTLSQGKMSMYGVRSVIGRSVAIHEDYDDGTRGSGSPGNSGSTFAFGVIAKRAPGVTPSSGGSVVAVSNVMDINVAAVTAQPDPDTIVCNFRPDIGPSGSAVNNGLTGKAMIKVLGYPHNTCDMRLEITGTPGSAGLSIHEKSLHFHKYGDLRFTAEADAGIRSQLVGAVYGADDSGLPIHSFVPLSDGSGVFYTNCSLDRHHLASYVGVGLSIHEGAELSTTTIAMAVCGLAHPNSCFKGDNGECIDLDADIGSGGSGGGSDGGGSDGGGSDGGGSDGGGSDGGGSDGGGSDGGGSDGGGSDGGGSDGGSSDGASSDRGGSGAGVTVGVTSTVCVAAALGMVGWRLRKGRQTNAILDATAPVEWVDADGRRRSSVPKPPAEAHPSTRNLEMGREMA